MSMLFNPAPKADTIPPVAGAGAQHSSTSTYACPVCDKPFTDKLGEDSIQCEEACKAWLYHCFAGLTKSEFGLLSQSSVPFFSVRCHLKSAEDHILALQSQVTMLTNRLDALNSTVLNSFPIPPSPDSKRISCSSIPRQN
uniref:Uncharacterized protein n=1 Tax=Amphimedon queenslandica TaxID=400682 RepID=A0A1X7U8M7_AMPQE